MPDSELDGEYAFMVVAQRPFEAGAAAVNLFCTLRPILMDDGTEAEGEDFPPSGLV